MKQKNGTGLFFVATVEKPNLSLTFRRDGLGEGAGWREGYPTEPTPQLASFGWSVLRFKETAAGVLHMGFQVRP